MCIPSYVKFYLLVIVQVIFLFQDGFFVAIAIFLGLLNFFIKCPKCNKSVGETKNGWVTPFRWYTCDKCGQNLLKCDVEPDEIINKRLK